MEDKQLDFNQPLLSARRYTSPARRPQIESKRERHNAVPKIPRPPVYKSELKSGPVRNPGTVPFVWEKTPGRPKEERKLQTQAVKQPSIAPKLPPGRVLDDNQHCTRQGSDSKTSSSSQNASSLNESETKCESSNGEMEETRSSGSVDSDDEAYVDAVDTLSRTESFFLNCSISGVSGLDGSEIKPSGVFSTDPQTRDFMMGRFLPAAKAVASETPPYATRKQPVIREPQIQTQKLVTVNKKQPNHVSIQNYVHAQDGWWEGSEDEDEDDYSQSENSSAKVCGLLPQFLLKNSFCLLNPIPGMKIQASKPLKAAYSVRRIQAKSSYMRSGNDTENEHAKATVEKGLTGISRIEEITEDKNNLKSGSRPISYRSDVRKPDGESLFRYLQGNDIPSHPNQISHLVHQEKGFLGIPEKDKRNGISSIDPLRNGCKNFQELLAMESSKQELGSDSPVVEKTLYVDSVHKVLSSNSPISDASALAQLMEDDSSFLKKIGEVKETPSVDSLLHDIEHMESAGDDKMAVVQHKSLEFLDSYSPGKYATDLQLDATRSRRDQDLIQDYGKLCLNMTSNRKDDKLSSHESSHGIIQDSITVTKTNAAERRKIDSEGHLQKKSGSNQERSHGSFSTIPLALPLPKAPSESWLKRTLPSVSSRNSSLSCLGTPNYTRTQASPVPSGDTKWEAIVRSSNLHHGHLRFSQEQLPPIPEA